MELTREEWLQHAVSMIIDCLPTSEVVVPQVQVSCSWPGGGSPAKRIGECWPRAASGAGVNEVFISPRIEDPVRVVGILTHELAHAADDCQNGHKAGFVKIARAMGLEGKPTEMVPAQEWSENVAAMVTAMCGDFPHRTVDKSKNGQKKQGTRMLKGECNECGAVWRMSATHMINVTRCPCCGGEDLTLDRPEPPQDGEEEDNDDRDD